MCLSGVGLLKNHMGYFILGGPTSDGSVLAV